MICILESSSPGADGTLVQLDKRLHYNVSHEENPRRSEHPPFIGSFVGCAVLNRSSRHFCKPVLIVPGARYRETLSRISIDQHFSW